jgi:hypothetical protein
VAVVITLVEKVQHAAIATLLLEHGLLVNTAVGFSLLDDTIKVCCFVSEGRDCLRLLFFNLHLLFVEILELHELFIVFDFAVILEIAHLAHDL